MIGGAVLLLATLLAADLDAEDPRARALAYRNLGDAADPASLDIIAQRLSTESDDTARGAGRDAMARLDLDEENLRAFLKESEVPLARAWAAHGLGRYPGADTVTVLIDAALDPEPSVRREVYESLAMIGDRAALPTLMHAANRDPSLALRKVAEESAAVLIKNERGRMDASSQIALLQSGTVQQKTQAAEQLANSGDWRAIQPLLHVMKSGPQPTRIAAIQALGALGDQRAVKQLVQLATEESGELRYQAISALAKLEDESSIAPLRNLLDDQDPRTRIYSIRALYWIGGPKTAEIVFVGLSDPSENVRIEVLLGLSRLQAEERLPLLLKAIEDSDPILRSEAARVLGQQGGDSANAALLEALGDNDALVRLTAADSLASLGEKEAIPLLEKLVSNTKMEDERALYKSALDSLAQ